MTEKHVRNARTVRGRITISQEADNLRHRTTLVARLLTSGPKPQIPPLYDVTIIASTGETWTLAGFERIESGPLQHLHVVGQAWIIEPVSIQELIDVERKWSAVSARVHELEQQLLAAGLQPVSPGSSES